MYCSKCGAENNNDNQHCVSCGASLVVPEQLENKNKSKHMYFSFVMNIVSAAFWIVYLLFLIWSLYSEKFTGGEYIREATISLISCLLDGIIIALGFYVYLCKIPNKKKVFSYIYLIGSVVLTCAYIFLSIINFGFLCCTTVIIYISCILQIIAGISFLLGIKRNV